MKLQKNQNKIYKIGIRREEFNKWERRCALTPRYCKKLLYKMKKNLIIKVQPSNTRIYTDSQFKSAGCQISENISDCDLIIGVKQVPKKELFPNRTYIFFAHVIKAQSDNMEMLDDILKKKIRLIDYEKISDEKNKRLVAFGKFAGNAGTIDILSGLGPFLLNRGIGSIFINVAQSYYYLNIDNAKNNLRQAGTLLEINGFVKELVPFVVGVTGKGRCAEGSLEILKLFPHEFIEPGELENLLEEGKKNPEKYNKTIFIVNFSHEHFVENKKDPSFFDKKDYYKNPQNYKGIFQQRYIQHLSVLINCIYWTDSYPKLVTGKYLKQITKKKKLRLLGISDVTCDYMGSIDFLKKFTTIDAPFFVYHPETEEITTDVNTTTKGLLYNSIENMPTQFPLDASNNFGNNLFPFIEKILKSDINKKLEDQNLPLEIKKAVITLNGQFTSLFSYISKLRQQRKLFEKKHIMDFRKNFNNNKIYLFNFEGHLFDTYAINKIMDVFIDENNVDLTVLDWKVGFGENKPTACIMSVSNITDLDKIIKSLNVISKEHEITFTYSEKVLD